MLARFEASFALRVALFPDRQSTMPSALLSATIRSIWKDLIGSSAMKWYLSLLGTSWKAVEQMDSHESSSPWYIVDSPVAIFQLRIPLIMT